MPLFRPSSHSHSSLFWISKFELRILANFDYKFGMPLLEGLVRLVGWVIPLVVLAIIILPQAIRILREYERGVIFRLGKLLGAKGPGLIFLIPIVDRMVRMDLRVVTISVE